MRKISYSQQSKYSEFDDDSCCSKIKQNWGCFTAAGFFVLVVAIIVYIVVTDTHKIHNNPYGFLENPMTDVYQSEPNWKFYSKDGNSDKFKTDFWQNNDFGTPVYNSIKLKQDDGTIDDLKNNLNSELKSAFDDRQKHHGYFILLGMNTNATDGIHFEDIQIFINDLTKENFDKLKEINNTRFTETPYRYDDYRLLLNGHGRVMFYTSDSKNPNDFSSNRLYMMSECFLENGLPSKQPTYGRIVKELHDDQKTLQIVMGFFSYKSRQINSVIRGKGIIVAQRNSEWEIDQQGLFTYSSFPQVSQSVQLIEEQGFLINKYADDDED